MRASKSSIAVFLLDDHDLVRKSVAELLDDEPDMHVVGESSTAAGALPTITATSPDVAVLDVRLRDGSGIEVCREIRTFHPTVQCLMLTSFSDDRAIVDSALAGANGFVLKQVRNNEIVSSVRRVAGGTCLLDQNVIDASLRRLRTAEAETLQRLSERETMLFDLISAGATNHDIARLLDIETDNARDEVAELLHHLGMISRSEAADARARHR